MAQTTGIKGILICMSEGLYAPFVEVESFGEARSFVCGYGSQAALEAGLANPRHWAHAVYRTMLRLCRDHQEELQGGSMDAHTETQLDRDTAASAS